MSTHSIRRTFGSALAGIFLAGSALAGNGALLGVTTGYPLINFVAATVPQGASYNGTTLSVTGMPVFITFAPSGAAEFISGGALSISANINAAGTFSSGTFSITGSVIDTMGTPGTGDDVSYSGTLLSGTVTNYGIINLGSTDLADFAMKATGGSLLAKVGGLNAAIGASVTLEGSTFAGSFASTWSATTTRGDVGPSANKIPFPCFNFSSLNVKNRSGTTNDEVHISKGNVRLNAGDTFHKATDDVSVTIGGLTVNIPAGNFVQVGTTQDYKYSTASGVKPKIKMRLNFVKSEWEFDLTDGNVALVGTGSVTVTLMVGNYTGSQTTVVSSHGTSSDSSSSHAPSCKLTGTSSDSATPGSGKVSSITSMSVRTPSARYVTKSKSGGTIKHPSTVVVDTVTGELATVDTSGGTCLRCGDVVTGSTGHAFQIMKIVGRPGDTLARKCGIYTSSCDILPPGY